MTPARTAAVLVGSGAVTAYGLGVERFWNGLLEGRSGIGPMPESLHAHARCRAAAVVAEALHDAEDRPHAQALGRGTVMALVAAREAQASHGLDVPGPRIGVVVGTGLGNMDLMDAALRQAGSRLSPALAFHGYAHAAACEVSRLLGAQGPLLTVSTGCNSGADAIGVALDWLRLGKCDLVYAGGTEAELVPGFLEAMTAARALQTQHNATPAEASRPFDRLRDGNVPGEGAAFVVLAREALLSDAVSRPKLLGATCVAYGSRPPYDPFRPVPDTRGMRAAMLGACEDAGTAPADIDLVSANGSSSVFYDVLEARALQEVLPQGPAVYSMKGALGQTGAVTPVLQAIAVGRSLATGWCPPTLNCVDPDPACSGIDIVTHARKLDPRRVLAHAIGFGGYYYAAQLWGHDRH